MNNKLQTKYNEFVYVTYTSMINKYYQNFVDIISDDINNC